MFGRFLAMMILLQAVMLKAAVINVPADQPTIQSGITSAGAGDTVLVARGTYYENLNFRGRNITVASRYLLTGDLTDIDSTVINGGSPAVPDSASCAMFISGEDTSSVLCGFTLTGGLGTKWLDEHGAGTYREGGGVLVAFSSPVIRNNLIIGNTVSGGSGLNRAGGGGIRAGDGNPRILNNAIVFNRGADYGGGIVLNYCGATVRNNIVYCNSGGAAYGGGGIWLNGNGASPRVIENNSIIGNSSGSSGGGLSYLGGAAAAVRNNIIWGNTSPEMTPGQPAAYCDIGGGWSGIGNIALEPAFKDLNGFILAGVSPCIDAGDSTFACNDPEDPGNPGQARWPAQGALRNDMGAYGGPGAAALSRVPTILTAVSPQSGATKVALTAPMVLSFSGPVDTSSLACYFSDTSLSVTRQWNARCDTLTLGHALPLASLEWYSLIIGGGRDSSGNGLALLPDTVRFRATDTVRPRLKSTVPADGSTGIALTAKLYLKFTRPVSRASLQFVFSDTSIHFTRAWYTGDTLAVLSHTRPFAGNTAYIFTVTAVADTFGNVLGGNDVPNPFSFTTLTTGVEAGPATFPRHQHIGWVAPNPVLTGQSPVLEIDLDQPGPVTARTYNALGQLVGQTANEIGAAGRHEVSLKTSNLAPGVYFIRVRTGTVSAIRKFTILR